MPKNWKRGLLKIGPLVFAIRSNTHQRVPTGTLYLTAVIVLIVRTSKFKSSKISLGQVSQSPYNEQSEIPCFILKVEEKFRTKRIWLPFGLCHRLSKRKLNHTTKSHFTLGQNMSFFRKFKCLKKILIFLLFWQKWGKI